MRILVLTNLYPPHGIGGYEERCRQTVGELRRRGHAVEVLTSDHRVPGRAEDGEPGVTRALRIHGHFGHPWLPVHRLYGLERHNHRVLAAALGAARPDVVHVWNMGGLPKSLLHALEAGPRPVVYDVSDHWIARSLRADVWQAWWNAPAPPGRRAARTAARLLGLRRYLHRRVPTAPGSALRFRHIYFCSAFLRDLTVSRGYPVAHGGVVYCGVEAGRFAVKEDWPPPRRILWVGRLAPDKDPGTALEGFLRARAAAAAPLELAIYGRGDEAFVADLRARAAAAGGAVRFGAAAHDEMRTLYARHDAFLFTSNWGEPFALTPLEAMASGVPVVMCPDGGDAELLRDGENALGFRAGDPDDLAAALGRLLARPDHGRSLAAEARREVLARFTVEAMCDRIEAILGGAAGEAAGGAGPA